MINSLLAEGSVCPFGSWQVRKKTVLDVLLVTTYNFLDVTKMT